ncbi:hypothetical protein ABT390_16505 [Streptomyces aurantiacus]|uniref:Uncharacterized protein n=1 Tax=Streptomyces aurantiacus JA 4570 TaxID=1286094 RepID=S4AIG5_9ACTN|nr:hypothetical protein [Streptomyces aurantiacus]EPH41242.1 hypothetical protein STRAU_5703 [Streptomyces aurantiacus JA 4570]
MSDGDGQDGRDGQGGRDELLAEELRALGRALDRPERGETMVERVLAQIVAEGVPAPVAEQAGAGERLRLALRRVRRGLRARWRALVASLCGLLTVLALTPPVRAAVFEWFDFGGVEVRYDPSPPPSGARTPGCGEHQVSLARAAREAGFRPVVPTALGEPDAAAVTREPSGRFLVTLCWREGGGTVRLDEFPAPLDPGYTKLVPGMPERLDLAGGTGLWFARPHRLELWMRDASGGDSWKRTVRPAGPTLLWTDERELTLRLEGVGSKARATAIAESVPD